MIPSSIFRSVLALLAGCLVTAGCASALPSKFYTLTPLKAVNETAEVTPVEEGDVLAVGPVRLPDYLDRPQIITRSEGNEVRMTETERWAGSLQEDVTRVLVENLSSLLSGKHVAVVRWPSAMQTMTPFQKRLAVEVLRFEGQVSGTVILKARYALFGPDDQKVISAGESIVREAASGSDYESLTAAMSRALGAFSREVAAAVLARGNRVAVEGVRETKKGSQSRNHGYPARFRMFL